MFRFYDPVYRKALVDDDVIFMKYDLSIVIISVSVMLYFRLRYGLSHFSLESLRF